MQERQTRKGGSRTRRKGRCSSCGGPTSTPKNATCRRCRTEASREQTRRRLIGEIRHWVALYDDPPTARDLAPVRARNDGRPDLAERFEKTRISNLSQFTRAFGSLNTAIVAAGYEPRRPGRPRARPS